MPGAKAGILCKCYRNTGTYAVPVWDEVTCIADLKIKGAWDRADANSRASRVKRGKSTMIDIGLTGNVLVQDDDPDFIALDNAFVTDTPIDMLVLNGAKDANGSRGWRAEWDVTTLGEDQSLGGVVMRDFEAAPSLTANTPKRAIVTGGVPVFTEVGVAA